MPHRGLFRPAPGEHCAFIGDSLMTEQHSQHDDASHSAPSLGLWHNTWQVLKTVQARLRFVAILVAIGLLIGYWDTLSNYYGKWTRARAAAESADLDTEYFCPMHPFIVRDDPKEKCPICHMDLARRKKGAGK